MDVNLEKDIKEFVKAKIKDIQYVDEIFLIQTFKISKRIHKKEEDLHFQFMIYKKVFQLTINVYNNYERYRDCEIKFIPKEKEFLVPLQHYYKFDDSRNVLRCIERPDENDVVNAFYNYAVCLLSLKKDRRNEEQTIDKCSFCDTTIDPDDDKCSVCEASIEKIVEKMKNERKVIVKHIPDNNKGDPIGVSREDDKMGDGHVWECAGCKFLNEASFLNCQACSIVRVNTRGVRGGGGKRNGGEDARDRGGKLDINKWACDKCAFHNVDGEGKCGVCGTLRHEDIVQYGQDEWRCSRCHFLNGFKDWKCVSCKGLFGDGMWRCGGCGLENRCANECCVGCENENRRVRLNKVDIAGDKVDKPERTAGNCVTSNQTRDGDKMKDRWICGKCGLFMEFSESICGACDGRKYANGLWNCDKCTFVNKCADHKCEACGAINDLLYTRHCQCCGKNVVHGVEDRCADCVNNQRTKWRCLYWDCEEWTDTNCDYCQRCQQWRYNDYRPGSVIKMLVNGKVIEVVRYHR